MKFVIWGEIAHCWLLDTCSCLPVCPVSTSTLLELFYTTSPDFLFCSRHTYCGCSKGLQDKNWGFINGRGEEEKTKFCCINLCTFFLSQSQRRDHLPLNWIHTPHSHIVSGVVWEWWPKTNKQKHCEHLINNLIFTYSNKTCVITFRWTRSLMIS